MKDLFCEFDFTKVGYFESVLESQGIKTFIRNRDLAGLAGEAAIMPELWPTLCVVNDEDYVKAMGVIRATVTENAERADTEIACAGCGETNPGNFDLCWSCGDSILVETDAST